MARVEVCVVCLRLLAVSYDGVVVAAEIVHHLDDTRLKSAAATSRLLSASNIVLPECLK